MTGGQFVEHFRSNVAHEQLCRELSLLLRQEAAEEVLKELIKCVPQAEAGDVEKKRQELDTMIALVAFDRYVFDAMQRYHANTAQSLREFKLSRHHNDGKQTPATPSVRLAAALAALLGTALPNSRLGQEWTSGRNAEFITSRLIAKRCASPSDVRARHADQRPAGNILRGRTRRCIMASAPSFNAAYGHGKPLSKAQPWRA